MSPSKSWSSNLMINLSNVIMIHTNLQSFLICIIHIAYDQCTNSQVIDWCSLVSGGVFTCHSSYSSYACFWPLNQKIFLGTMNMKMVSHLYGLEFVFQLNLCMYLVILTESQAELPDSRVIIIIKKNEIAKRNVQNDVQ